MSFISNQFKVGDHVMCMEDIVSPVYKITFPKGHEFKVLGIEKTGLVLEDISDGLVLKNVGFLRFKRITRKASYLDTGNSGWVSDR